MPPKDPHAEEITGEAEGKSTVGVNSERETKKQTHRSGFHRFGGSRPMKEYPLTKGELTQLAAIGLASTLFYSIATFCAGAWFEIVVGLALSDKLSPEKVGYLEAMKDVLGIVSIGFVALGTIALIWDGLVAISIIRETKHKE